MDESTLQFDEENGMFVLVDEINRHLPPDIQVMNIIRVSNKFDAKNYCTGRKYGYILPTYVFLEKEEMELILDSLSTCTKREKIMAKAAKLQKKDSKDIEGNSYDGVDFNQKDLDEMWQDPIFSGLLDDDEDGYDDCDDDGRMEKAVVEVEEEIGQIHS